MYADPLVINNGVASVSYAKRKLLGNQSEFVSLSENSEDATVTLRILHAKTKPKKAPANYMVNRHVITYLRDEYKGDTTGFHEAFTCNLSLAVPNTGSITRAEIDAAINTIKNFLTVDTVDRLLRGEL